MGKVNFIDKFKRDALAKITERGCRAAEVPQLLGVDAHSLCTRKRKFAMALGDAGKNAEIRK